MPAVWSEFRPVRPSSFMPARISATPPPTTTPSCTAARVAFSESSTRSLRSFTSISEAPPTRITATPPASFASRSYAIDGNPEAARLSGINLKRIIVRNFVIAGLGYGTTGVALTARVSGAIGGTAGLFLELDAIADAIIGGTALSGGRARVLGALPGALLLGSLNNGMGLMNVPTFHPPRAASCCYSPSPSTKSAAGPRLQTGPRALLDMDRVLPDRPGRSQERCRRNGTEVEHSLAERRRPRSPSSPEVPQLRGLQEEGLHWIEGSDAG